MQWIYQRLARGHWLRIAAFLLWLPCSVAAGTSFEGEAASPYNAFCDAGHRAVWVETFDAGPLAGYVHLVCLDEARQETSFWWITPAQAVIPEDELPEFTAPVRPVLDTTLQAIIASADHPINVDSNARQPVLIRFRVESPPLPPLPYDYGSMGSSGTGENGVVISVNRYWVEGEEVDEATFNAYADIARAAEREQRQQEERRQHQQAQLQLYDLVNLNDWHAWLDVEAINSQTASNACWQYNTTLLTHLTRDQLEQMAITSRDLVYVQTAYGPPVDEDGGVTATTDDIDATSETPDWSVASICMAVNANSDGVSWYNDGSSADVAGGGAPVPGGGSGTVCWLLLLASAVVTTRRRS